MGRVLGFPGLGVRGCGGGFRQGFAAAREGSELFSIPLQSPKRHRKPRKVPPIPGKRWVFFSVAFQMHPGPCIKGFFGSGLSGGLCGVLFSLKVFLKLPEYIF